MVEYVTRRGGRARLKASDSKSDRGASPSGVQILSPPPNLRSGEFAVSSDAPAASSAAGGEGWPSGRRCGTGNAVYGQLYRGFESHPLRHFSGKDPMSLSVGETGPVARRRPKSAREASSPYVERAIEGANEANGPLSATDAQAAGVEG